VAPTQDALYRRIDLDLSWSERELPERVRTKHVHRLHPYLGKFVPQLVEAMLERHLPGAKTILDPFAGSGTTLVQSLESGRDATGVDVAAFNCLLMRVKTAEYNLFSLEHELRDSLRRLDAFDGARPARPNRYLDAWYAPKAAAQLVFYRSLVDDYEHADVLRVVLTRAARSARRTTSVSYMSLPKVHDSTTGNSEARLIDLIPWVSLTPRPNPRRSISVNTVVTSFRPALRWSSEPGAFFEPTTTATEPSCMISRARSRKTRSTKSTSKFATISPCEARNPARRARP